jgi:hypothetical protein
MISLAALRAIAERHDPETLIGPLLGLFTRIAAHGDAQAREVIADHLTVLAAHPAVGPELRLAAGALALEHRSLRTVPGHAPSAGVA